jgi:hypothetical protein
LTRLLALLLALVSLLPAATSAAEPPPPSDQERLQQQRYRVDAEADPERRGRLLVTLHAEAFRLGAPGCVGDAGTDACSRLIETRLNLHRTAKVREAFAHGTAAPSPRALLCEGVPVLPCLRRSFKSDWLSTNASLAPDRTAFVSARRRGDDRVQFVVGEVFTDDDGGATHVVVLADDTVTDPLLAAMAPDVREPHRSVGPRQALEPDGYVVTVASSTFATSRPLRADEAVYAVCDQRVERVDRPSLTAIGIAEVEWGDGGAYPEYRYALPCVARVVLSGSIAGIRTGPYVPTTLGREDGISSRTTTAGAVTVREAVNGCSVEGPGATLTITHRYCGALFVGDVTGDTRADVVFEVRGEMGCGGPRLFLSGPLGWTLAGSSGGYC